MLLELQTEFGDGKRDKALRIGVEPVPLSYQVEGCHGEGQTGTEVNPDPMGYFLQMPHLGQHGQGGLHQHPLVLLAPAAELQIGWITGPGMETQVGQYHHFPLELGYQRLEIGVMNVGSGAVPGCYQTQMVEQQAQLSTHNPTVVGFPLLPDLGTAAAFPDRVDQFDTIGINDTQQGRGNQEVITPVLVLTQQSEETGAVGQLRKHIPMVLGQPSVESPVAHPFDDEEQANVVTSLGLKAD